jgi:hypothetical protein
LPVAISLHMSFPVWVSSSSAMLRVVPESTVCRSQLRGGFASFPEKVERVPDEGSYDTGAEEAEQVV